MQECASGNYRVVKFRQGRFEIILQEFDDGTVQLIIKKMQSQQQRTPSKGPPGGLPSAGGWLGRERSWLREERERSWSRREGSWSRGMSGLRGGWSGR